MPKKIIDDIDEDITEDEMEEELEREKRRPVKRPQRVEQTPKKPEVRFRGFVQQQREGIVDVEANEVLAENVWDALANIIERLERIESQIGGL